MLEHLTSSFRKRRNQLFVRKKEQYPWSCRVKVKEHLRWWEKFVNGEVPESYWVKNVRIMRKSFEELNAKLHSFVEKQRTKMRKPISIETQVAQNSREAEVWCRKIEIANSCQVAEQKNHSVTVQEPFFLSWPILFIKNWKLFCRTLYLHQECNVNGGYKND